LIKKNIKFSIAIDGSSASGKTTGSKIISKKFKFKLLSSGKLYRYLALKIINKNKKYDQKFIRKQSKEITLPKLKNKKLNTPQITKNHQ
jgi:Cytidylate kinase